MATVIPFPAERLDDPADVLFLALMRSMSAVRGELVELAALPWAATRQDNAALDQAQEVQAVLF